MTMTTTFIAQRIIAAAVLATTALLLGVVPAAASTEQSGDLRGWVSDRDATQSDSTGSSQAQDLRGWISDRDTTQSHSAGLSSSGIRAVERDTTPSGPAPTQTQSRPVSPQIPPQLIVAGLVLAALLGAAGASALNHRRHVPTAH